MIDVDRVRPDFPVTRHRVYLNTGTLGPSPQPVTDAALTDYRSWQEAGPGDPRVYRQARRSIDSCRARVAQWLGASPDEIAFGGSATEGVNTVLWGLDWRPGDELIITDQEHAAVFAPALNLHERLGVQVRVLAASGEPEQLLSRLRALLTGHTRLVCISHVLYSNGCVLPVEAITETAHAAGSLVCLDGAQALGQIEVDVRRIGCDFYACNAHKWTFGPCGCGALFVCRDNIEALRPSWTGAGAILKGDGAALGPLEWEPSARRYEFATHNWAFIQGWERALDYLDGLGRESIWRRTLALARRLRDGLAACEGISILSPDDDRLSGLVTCRPAGRSGEEAFELLAEEGIVGRPVRLLDAVRFSTAFFNTEEEIDRTVAAVAALVRRQ